MMVVRPECCDKNEISYYSRTSAYKTSSGAGRGVGWVGGSVGDGVLFLATSCGFPRIKKPEPRPRLQRQVWAALSYSSLRHRSLPLGAHSSMETT